MPPFLIAGASLLLACGSLALLSCGPMDEPDGPITEGPSTETGNPALTGILRDASGSRAGGARVVLWKLPQAGGDTALHLAPTRVDSQAAKADGSFRFPSLAPGAYALEGAEPGRGLFALLPRAEIPAGVRDFLRRDTLVLQAPGLIRGKATRDGNPLPAGVRFPGEGIVVRLAGTGRSALTDSAGRYALENVPAGVHQVAFAAADGHYLPALSGAVEVAPGGVYDLPPTVLSWSPFVDPPVPAGLSVSADSAAGLMRLRWRGVKVSNFHHYEVIRRDSLDSAFDAAWSTTDTAFADTLEGVPSGRWLRYAVVAVNALGARSAEGGAADPIPAPKPRPPDTALPAGSLAALVLDGPAPARAWVRLHAAPAGATPLDSLLRWTVAVDSAWTGADGQVAFSNLPAGLYTLEAATEAGAGPAAKVAAALGLRPRADLAPVTLRLGAPATLRGTATRNHIWCTTAAKLNEYIQVSLQGTPWFTFTDPVGSYSLRAPAGGYTVIVQALPPGCYLPDTLAVDLQEGQETVLPGIPTRANPGFIPKLAGLRISISSREGVTLEWPAAPSGFEALGGYEVLRRDGELKVLASSGLIAETAWRDNLSAIPSGMRINYVVRAIRRDGEPGPFGGDLEGKPVYFTVP